MNAVSTQAGALRARFHGSGGELFVIFIVNLLLKVVTLGIYHFWGKARVRRYLWTQCEFDGDRFEYTGTGGELFVGFLKAMGLLIIGAAAFVGIMLGLGAVGGILATVVMALLVLGLAVGMPIAFSAVLYSAQRYKMSRTRWRGIRFALGGSAWRHGYKAFGYWLISAFTLGLYTPYMRMHLAKHMIDNSRFGQTGFSFSGQGGDLFKRYLAVYALGLLAAGTLVFALVSGGGPALIGVAVALVTVSVGAWFWYVTMELRYKVRQTRLGALGFELDATAWQFAGLAATNFLLFVVTLGIGLPWVLARTLRFLGEHVVVVGELDYDAILQSQEQADTLGEGMVEALDIGGL
jgi:uncharacterized membrane protein YjgN (DUF898 family)